MIATCNAYEDYADTPPVYYLQVFTTSGHLLDTVKQTCDPKSSTPATIVVPESLAAGQYQVSLNTGGDLPVSVVILDASPQ